MGLTDQFLYNVKVAHKNRIMYSHNNYRAIKQDLISKTGILEEDIDCIFLVCLLNFLCYLPVFKCLVFHHLLVQRRFFG